MKTYRSAREVLREVEQVLAPHPRLVPRGRLPLRQIRGASVPESPLEQVAKLLRDGRQYFAVTIYLEAGGRLLRMASAGPAPRCDAMRLGEGNVGQAATIGVAKIVPDVARDPQYVEIFPETRSELVMPIKIGAHVIGVFDVESERLNTFSFEHRVLLHEIATVVAQFLAGPGKYLVMKTREAAQDLGRVGERPHPVSPKAGETRMEQPGETRMGQRQAIESERRERLRAAAGEKARS